MLITLKESKTVERKVEIELPYFYKHDHLADNYDCIDYGKITETAHYCVSITKHGWKNPTLVEIELSSETRSPHNLGCYFTEDCRSTEEEFLAALQQLTSSVSAIAAIS